MIGEVIEVNGEKLYAPGYYDNGICFGHIYKNEVAFYSNPDEVCYINEYAFEEADKVVINGKDYYRTDGYTRKDLEDICEGMTYEDGEKMSVEAFFSILEWAAPETYAEEMFW